jgi:hypothetical protein
MTDEPDRIWNESVLGIIEIKSWNLFGGTKENHEKYHSGLSVFGQGIELSTT